MDKITRGFGVAAWVNLSLALCVGVSLSGCSLTGRTSSYGEQYLYSVESSSSLEYNDSGYGDGSLLFPNGTGRLVYYNSSYDAGPEGENSYNESLGEVPSTGVQTTLARAVQYDSENFGGDRVVIERLPEPQLELTPEVHNELKHFVRHKAFITSSMSRYTEMYGEIADIFRDVGVPESLINLAIVESQFKLRARSHKGATGLWQFMRATARELGLNTHPRDDDRYDPIKSSRAAATYLRELYEKTGGDWFLALASYNAGIGTVTKAMKRGGTRDFWTLARKGLLPHETRRYVPRFIAVCMIMNDPQRFGFDEIA